jgi:glucose-1-phosphate thymidylyltransferase
MKSLVMAAGFGTRLYPLTQSKAKALLPYKGKPLISHVIEKIPRDIDILVNVNRKFEADFLRWQNTIGRKVTICVEPVSTEQEALGAVGSIEYWVKEKKITEDLLVLASDNYFEFDLSRFIAAYNGRNPLVAVFDTGDRSKVSEFGVVQLKGNRIIELVEKPKKPKSSLVAIACYIFPPRVFPLISRCCPEEKKDNLGNFISYLAEKDEVEAYTFTEAWYDIGNLEVYTALQRKDISAA